MERRNANPTEPAISEDEAREIVLGRARPLGVETRPVADSVGLVLAETVASDVDMPPFDRAAMDGYAVHAADLAVLPADLTVVESIPAGRVCAKALGPGECAEIMTGAPVPPDADAVVPVEDTERAPGGPPPHGQVRILKAPGKKANIAFQGEDLKRGDVVLEPGRLLRPPEVGLAAMVGRATLAVHRRPSVAVVATGDELVSPDVQPGPGQTRNCNSYTLLAECARLGIAAADLGIARDTPDELERKIREGLERDVLILSGGVSTGAYDLVSDRFAALGLAVHFHRLRVKPGMPTVFATAGDRLVFGLPGNPTPVVLMFRLLVEPALRRLAGQADVKPHRIAVALTAPVEVRGRRRTYLPARFVRQEADQAGAEPPLVEPVASHGSADLMAMSRADVLIQVDQEGTLPAGTVVPALPLEP